MSPFTVPLFINGQERHPPDAFDVVSPASGTTAHRCSAASLDDAAAAVDAAAAALASWKRMAPTRRRDILLNAARIIDNRREEIAPLVMEETGLSRSFADFDVSHATEVLKDAAFRATTLEGSFPTMADPATSGVVMREPYGVVLSIAPWNAPIILGARAFALPLAAGNTVVLKASENAPRCGWVLVSAMREAGLPGGVLNMIVLERSAAPSVTAALIANPHVKKINFTGSTPVGRIIAKQAGEHLKPVVLELGGKAPAIVWEDADLPLAARQCALGAFDNSGQICMSTERILVHESVKSQFVELFKVAVEEEFPSSADAPTLISSAAVGRNKKLVADAAGKGAHVVYGDMDSVQVSATRMRPIVVDNVTADMDIYHLESFGPTVSLIGIDSEEQAIAIANDCHFGLSSAIFTEDLRRGLRLAREIETGAVHINRTTVNDEMVLPHGGAKCSGWGRFNGARGLDEWVRTKNVTFRN